MTIRIASFNLQNDFTRPSAMMMDGAEGLRALDDHALANAIVAKRVYSESDKQTLSDLDRQYPFSTLDPPANARATLNKVRGDLFPRAHGTVSVTANGRSDWTGWFDLRREGVSRKAVPSTGRAIEAAKPDTLACEEVENRPTLQRFDDQTLGESCPHDMAIDGNDARGIDVGLLSRYPIVASARTSMTSMTARAWLKPQPPDVHFRTSRAGKHRSL